MAGTNWPSGWYAGDSWNLPDPHYPCRKDKFWTKVQAKAAIKAVMASGVWVRKDGKPTPYRCNNCGLWHWGHKRTGSE